MDDMKQVVVMTVLILLLSPLHAFSDVTIIANKSVPVDKLSKEEVNDIFIGRMLKWPDDSTITFYILKEDDDIHKQFLRIFVKRSPSQFERYWRNRLFTGLGSIPKKFSTTEGLIKAVENNAGAIAYCDKPVDSDKVKTLIIE